jgi:MFS family permease
MIGYAYGNKTNKGDPKFDIKADYPDLKANIGYLTGVAFTSSFAICGIFGGIVADKANRTLIIGAACFLWSACTLFTGVIDSFAMLFLFRFLLGVFESAFNPCSYSIIADYFHPDYRATANALFNSGIYLGGALASLSNLIINKWGWRSGYIITGAIGGGVAVLQFFFVREPTRGAFNPVKAVSTT